MTLEHISPGDDPSSSRRESITERERERERGITTLLQLMLFGSTNCFTPSEVFLLIESSRARRENLVSRTKSGNIAGLEGVRS